MDNIKVIEKLNLIMIQMKIKKVVGFIHQNNLLYHLYKKINLKIKLQY